MGKKKASPARSGEATSAKALKPQVGAPPVFSSDEPLLERPNIDTFLNLTGLN
jgi:hypothetical protein